MAAPTGTHVLLETVAPHAYKGGQSSEAGGGQTHSDFDGHQQQELLAPFTVAGDASGGDERLVEGTGAGEYPRSLDESPRVCMRNSCALCS